MSCFLNYDFIKQNNLEFIKTIKPETTNDIMKDFGENVTIKIPRRLDNMEMKTLYVYKNPNYKGGN
jgi:hypothetical protein